MTEKLPYVISNETASDIATTLRSDGFDESVRKMFSDLAKNGGVLIVDDLSNYTSECDCDLCRMRRGEQ